MQGIFSLVKRLLIRYTLFIHHYRLRKLFTPKNNSSYFCLLIRSMHYTNTMILSSNHGNNTFAYDQRVQETWSASISIPSKKTIQSIDQVSLWNTCVFCERDDHGIVVSYIGLAHLYLFDHAVIFDNHNHALYWWAWRRQQHGLYPVIHIDQHADLWTPLKPFARDKRDDMDYVWEYTQYYCTVGSFIQPALTSGIITSCEQRRTEYAVLHNPIPDQPFILDIDLDFRDPRMTNNHTHETINRTKTLIQHATFVTIATSPYFLDQSFALEVLRKLFD